MHFNLFSIAGIVLATTCFFLTFILLLYGKSYLHKIWALFNFIVGIWGLGAFYIGQIQEYEKALMIWRAVHLAVIFIPVLNYHVVYILFNLRQKKILYLIYCQGVVFSYIALTSPLFIPKVKFVFNSFYYDVAGPFFYPFFAVWSAIVGYSHYLLFSVFNKAEGRLRSQILYFFIGTALGFSGGITNFLPALGINSYPFGNFTIPIYCLVVTYAILRYRLLDVTVAITRTSIFIAVYSIVLGLPFILAFGWKEILNNLIGENWWLVPLISSTVLATGGPYVYGYVQQRAEDRLLAEQRQYQATLRQASLGMGRIKDLKRLLQLIVHIVTRAVRIEHCEIYLLHEDSKKYVLKASKSNTIVPQSNYLDAKINPLIKELLTQKEPIVYEEVKQRAQDYKDRQLNEIETVLKELDASLVVPSFIENRLIAIIIMGKKRSGKLYSQDDLVVFSILANQSALAIENAIFYEDMKKTHEQLFKAEKMATIGTMADGLSHQINNRLHAMGFISGDALDSINLKRKDMVSPEAKELLDEVAHALERIQDNVKRGGEIVEGLLKYTRKGAEGFEAVNLNKLIDAAVEMAQFKIKLKDMDIIRNIDASTPMVMGNFTQLQEVFFNVIDNGYDAMMQRRDDLKEPNYRARLEISAIKKGKSLEIFFLDNGIGIKEENHGKIFTPFFTTKLSSRKGTGLGMYVIRQIVEENHQGKVSFKSEYKVGSEIKILLPVFQGKSNIES